MEEKFIQLYCTKCTISDDKGNLQVTNSIDSLGKILEKENTINVKIGTYIKKRIR